jgi:hypothetical protein
VEPQQPTPSTEWAGEGVEEEGPHLTFALTLRGIVRMASGNFFRPFTAKEHRNFLQSLSKYEGVPQTDSDWAELAAQFGPPRSIVEVKAHAYRYMLVLQAHTPRGIMQEATSEVLRKTGAEWTFEDDAVFEGALATVAESDTQRWEKIAALMPSGSLSPVDVRNRFQLLLMDLLRIELGEITTVTYATG